MGTEPWPNLTRLIRELEEDAPSFNVFQAIFIAEKISGKIFPERDEAKFDQQGLRFRSFERYVFPPKDIRTFRHNDREMEFVINFMGLYGINSPLPRCYHEQVSSQQTVHGAGRVALQNFLDIFNNRFYWLYYQAWKKYRYRLNFSGDPGNKSMQKVFSFIGLGPHPRRAALPFPQLRLLQFSDVLSRRIRSKSSLLILLREFFPDFSIRIKEFIPTRVVLSELPRLSREMGGEEICLGQNSVLGRSVWDYMSRILLEIGPIGFETYLELLPGGRKARLLKLLLGIYLNDALPYDVLFIVNADSIPRFNWEDRRLRLGKSIWLGKPQQKTIRLYYQFEKF